MKAPRLSVNALSDSFIVEVTLLILMRWEVKVWGDVGGHRGACHAAVRRFKLGLTECLKSRVIERRCYRLYNVNVEAHRQIVVHTPRFSCHHLRSASSRSKMIAISHR